MHFIDPDVLTAARGLSQGGSVFLLLIGLMLWTCGWRWHRFWVVFSITMIAGIIGMSAGRSAGGQVMVVGILMAVAAGVMALELARLLAFATGGTAAWMMTQTIFPAAHELWAIFLSGGLLGVVLYRLWTMLTTSFVGGIVAAHAGLVTAEGVKPGFDAAMWASSHAAALNGAAVAAAILGVVIQARLSPKDHAEAMTPSEHGKEKNPKKLADNHHPSLASHPHSEPGLAGGWLGRVRPGSRQAA